MGKIDKIIADKREQKIAWAKKELEKKLHKADKKKVVQKEE